MYDTVIGFTYFFVVTTIDSGMNNLSNNSKLSILFWPCVAISGFHVLDAFCYAIQGMYLI